MNLIVHSLAFTGYRQEESKANLKLEEFARLCGRSLSSFKRDFIVAFNTTQGRWLARKKLEHAQHLLETTDKNISEVTFEAVLKIRHIS